MNICCAKLWWKTCEIPFFVHIGYYKWFVQYALSISPVICCVCYSTSIYHQPPCMFTVTWMLHCTYMYSCIMRNMHIMVKWTLCTVLWMKWPCSVPCMYCACIVPAFLHSTCMFLFVACRISQWKATLDCYEWQTPCMLHVYASFCIRTCYK